MNNGPMSGKMVGLTHREDGSLIIKQVKVLKVGIGLPKGPALNVWMQKDPDGVVRWKMMKGYKNGETKTGTFSTRQIVEAKFNEAYKDAPVCPYPRKLPYFTFTKPILIDKREQYVPDFDAIEAHGITPTEIDVILLSDTPFDGSFAMWSASECKCRGDGLNAMRVASLATPEQQHLIQPGEKYFPIINGCWARKCPFSIATVGPNGREVPAPCKPDGELHFQLASNLRVGGTAFFHTTGIRSIQSTFSSLFQISTLTGGRLLGIPLKMVLRSFNTNHNNQPSTAYAVSLEFRAPDVATMRQKLLETVFEFRSLASGSRAALAAPTSPEIRLIDSPEDEDDNEVGETPSETGTVMSAEAITDEFYPEVDGTEDPEKIPAAVKTEAKTATLADKLTKARAPKVEAPAAVPVTSSDPGTSISWQSPGPKPAAQRPPDADPSKGDLF